MSMSKSKILMAGGAFVCVLVLIASWFLLIGPKRAEAAEFEEQTVSAQDANAALRLRIAKLEKQFNELDSLKSEMDAIRESMPADVAESTLLREVQGLASGTGTTFVSATAGEPTPLIDPNAPTAPPPSEGEAASDSEGSSDSESPSADPAAAAPLDTMVYSVPVTFVAVSSFQGSQAFLQNLQDNMPRALLVSDLTIQAREPGDEGAGRPIAANGDVELTITGNVFVLDAPDFELDGTITENEPSATAPASAPSPTSNDSTSTEPPSTEESSADAPSAGPSVAAN